jgi:hypothetical protein
MFVWQINFNDPFPDSFSSLVMEVLFSTSINSRNIAFLASHFVEVLFDRLFNSLLILNMRSHLKNIRHAVEKRAFSSGAKKSFLFATSSNAETGASPIFSGLKPVDFEPNASKVPASPNHDKMLAGLDLPYSFTGNLLEAKEYVKKKNSIQILIQNVSRTFDFPSRLVIWEKGCLLSIKFPRT